MSAVSRPADDGSRAASGVPDAPGTTDAPGAPGSPATAGTDRRFPRSVYGHGAEPDARFSLANERTFLAWLRTSLALLAAGVALEALDLPLHPGLRLAAAVVLVVLGVLAPVQAWIGWARTERALRERRPLPAPALSGPLAVGLLVAGVLVLLGVLLP